LEGALPVIPTPFLDGGFDALSFEAMVGPMLPHVDGFVLLGSTGEAPSLARADRMSIAEEVLTRTPRDKKVVVGVSSPSSTDTIALAKHAQEHGAVGVLCCAPFYFTNTGAGMRRFFAALDRELEVDLVLYDNPVTTKTALSAEYVLDLAEDIEHLRAVKLTDHLVEKVATWRGRGLSVFAGDDAILFQYLSAGVDGMMVIAPLLYPEAMAEVWRLLKDGATAKALQVMAANVLPVLHALGVGREVAGTKQILAQRKTIRSAEVLAPLVGVTHEEAELLKVADDVCSMASW